MESTILEKEISYIDYTKAMEERNFIQIIERKMVNLFGHI
jgi:hypothetical protein